MIHLKLAQSSGFCFGVDHAVKTAYACLADSSSQKPLYMLGPITHNETVVSDLLSKGFQLIESPEEVEPNSTVLIRAHGISPDVHKKLDEKACVVIDCTCPYVEKIHRIVRKADQEGKHIIITGTKGHPEVDGICGEADNGVHVVSNECEINNLQEDLSNTIIVSQTTFSTDEFKKIRENIKNKIANDQIFDTICSTTENRQREAKAIASSSDYMLVIGSRGSSNTMKLFEICKRHCADTFLICNADELSLILPKMDLSKEEVQVGITAGASTPESIIREVIRTLSENEGMANQEQMDINFGDYIDNIPQLRKNATVKGAITSADNEFVYVDVHDKSEGRIPRHEFANDPDFDLDEAIANHQEIEVYVRSVRNSDMGKEILLSKAHVDFGKYKTQIEDAFENKTPVTVKVTNVVKDGVIATFGGVDIYIHRTQLEMNVVEDLDSYKGKTIQILVTQFDPDKRRLRVSGSRRSLLHLERRAKAEEVWGTIVPGAEYDGVVRSLTDFGAFVDIGGVDGLVHVSELSWNRIRHPSEVVKVGETIHVFVKDFDPEKKRISLGYKKPEDDPYHDIEERFPVGSIVHGKVVRMFQFGAFVELEPGLDALCHVSQISNVRLNKPDDVLSEGMEIDARVLEVNNEARRISISIKEVEPIDPEVKEEEAQVVAEAEIVEEKPVEVVSEITADVASEADTAVVEEASTSEAVDAAE